MDISKYRKHIAVGCLLLASALFLIALVLYNPKEKTEEAAPQNVYPEIPTPESSMMPDKKREAYILEPKKEKIELLWDDSLPGEEMLVRAEKEPKIEASGPKPASQSELFPEASNPTVSPVPKKASSNPYRESAQEREARHQRRHEEAIELAERMQEGQKDPYLAQDDATIESKATETIPLPQSQVKRSDVISSLDGWEGDGGFSSLDDEHLTVADDPYTPFRCMFARDSKVTDGQRVTVILLDDLMVSGISVPRNTHLMATCQISSRLELEFNNLEIGGRILPLGYEAYDVDGSKGIYCPDAGSTSKTVKNRGTDIISSSLSSRLGRVARDVATTGIAIAQSADGQRTVSIPAGYTFFIIKKKQN